MQCFKIVTLMAAMAFCATSISASAIPTDVTTTTTNSDGSKCTRKLIKIIPPASSTAAVPSSTSTTVPVADPTAALQVKPVVKATTTSTGSGGVSGSNGQATFYYQKGVAGACGNINPDSAMIVALNNYKYRSSLCGKTISIKSLQTGKTVQATVADRCPGCGPNDVDLSTGLFAALGGTQQEGVFKIDWTIQN